MKQIQDGWMKVNGQRIEDLEKYILDYLAEDKEIELWIGTDSAKKIMGYQLQEVKYLTVICFRKPFKGAHVIKRIENKKYEYRISIGERLGYEIDLTIQLALWIREVTGISVEIHIDVNPESGAGSNEVYKTYKGYGEALGFKTEYKPTGSSIAASACADYFIGG